VTNEDNEGVALRVIRDLAVRADPSWAPSL
jgi:hypothetical protein